MLEALFGLIFKFFCDFADVAPKKWRFWRAIFLDRNEPVGMRAYRRHDVSLLFLLCLCCLPFSLALGRLDSGLDAYTSNTAKGNSQIIELPIFPLRKTARFPTDFLKLNLYEERYLALAERILQENGVEGCTFGALYTSNKAQVVSNKGCGPIVL